MRAFSFAFLAERGIFLYNKSTIYIVTVGHGDVIARKLSLHHNAQGIMIEILFVIDKATKGHQYIFFHRSQKRGGIMASIKLQETCVIAVANSKGGSGKSTTTSMLARSLGEKNYRVLVIDCDSQMDLTNTLGFTVDESLVEFGLELTDFNKTIYQMIRQKGDPTDYIVPTRYKNLDLIAGDDYIGRIEYELHHEYQREQLLKKLMQDLIDSKRYDFIIFDTSTHLGDLAANILNITHKVIIPVPMAMFGIRGIRTFIDFYNQFTEMNPRLSIMGIVMTMYRPNNKIINERAEKLLHNIFGRELIFKTQIPIDANIEKAQWNNVTAYEFAPKSRASEAYKNLAREVIKRVKE